MPESIALNCDCMEYMRSLPDKAFDLAVVDPPYGGGCSQSVKAERERETGSTAELLTTKANPGRGSAASSTATISAARTGGTWAAKYRQRTPGLISVIGISPRLRNTSMSLPA